MPRRGRGCGDADSCRRRRCFLEQLLQATPPRWLAGELQVRVRVSAVVLQAGSCRCRPDDHGSDRGGVAGLVHGDRGADRPVRRSCAPGRPDRRHELAPPVAESRRSATRRCRRGSRSSRRGRSGRDAGWWREASGDDAPAAEQAPSTPGMNFVLSVFRSGSSQVLLVGDVLHPRVDHDLAAEVSDGDGSSPWRRKAPCQCFAQNHYRRPAGSFRRPASAIPGRDDQSGPGGGAARHPGPGLERATARAGGAGKWPCATKSQSM